jgi:hypothetical protein
MDKDDKIELFSQLSMIFSWIIWLFLTCVSFIWFKRIDFDPNWETDNAFMLTGIVFVSVLHILSIGIMCIFLFIKDFWDEIYHWFENFYEAKIKPKI